MVCAGGHGYPALSNGLFELDKKLHKRRVCAVDAIEAICCCWAIRAIGDGFYIKVNAIIPQLHDGRGEFDEVVAQRGRTQIDVGASVGFCGAGDPGKDFEWGWFALKDAEHAPGVGVVCPDAARGCIVDCLAAIR